MSAAMATTKRRGSPLAMIAILLGIWVTGRTVMWESPFALDLPDAIMMMAENSENQGLAQGTALLADTIDTGAGAASPLLSRAYAGSTTVPLFAAMRAPRQLTMDKAVRSRAIMAAGHQYLLAAAFRVDWPGSSDISAMASFQPEAARVSPTAQSFGLPLEQPTRRDAGSYDRWSLDAFAFYRAGSRSAAISQGRVPVYGASQVGANLQYRFAPSSSVDPRAFVRGYRAFVPDGENEAAIGVSARPIGKIPLRVYAELRATDNEFGTELRPAAYAVTELPPIKAPLDVSIEAYAGAGYVGGTAATPFVDGQAAATRELVQFQGVGDRPVRLSIGGGAWGGAQSDANRLDVGPTMRIDLSVGPVPARISVDWRERVAGDAAPESGIAATLSTRF